MIDSLQIKPMLGTGIFTVPDIAEILRLPYFKINRWLNNFWNDQFSQKYGSQYSWNVNQTKAVNFYTLIEINTFYQLNQAGVKTKEIINAHDILSNQFITPYPFATEQILKSLKTDGRKVIFEQQNGVIYSVDNCKQTYLNIIKDFYRNIDFEENSLASRLWPLGKDRDIVCDPQHQFGQPIIFGTNIFADTIYNLYKAGEPEDFISELYGIDVSKVNNAIIFCKKAA